MASLINNAFLPVGASSHDTASANPTYTGSFGFSYSSLNRNTGNKKASHNGNRMLSRMRNFNTRNNGMGGCKPPANCASWNSSLCVCWLWGD